MHSTGCMLYWAEGSKGKWSVEFANSNVEMVKIFVNFIDRCFDAKDKITVNIHCYLNNGISEDDVHLYWVKHLNLDLSCFRKLIVPKKHKFSQVKKKGKLPYGVCHIRIHSVELLYRIYGAIEEYTKLYQNLERPYRLSV